MKYFDSGVKMRAENYNKSVGNNSVGRYPVILKISKNGKIRF
jgi:hypothetical protein